MILLTLRVFLKRIRVTPVAAGRCRRVARRCGPTRRFVAGPRREGGARSRKHRLAGSHPHDLNRKKKTHIDHHLFKQPKNIEIKFTF